MTAYIVIGAATMQAGLPEDISQVLANFQSLESILASLTDGNIDAAANITLTKLAGNGQIGNSGFFLNSGGNVSANAAYAWGVALDCSIFRQGAGALRSSNSGLQMSGGVGTLVKAGAPVDGDFAVGIRVDGMLAVDTTNNKIWARVGGVWKGVVIA